MGDARVGVNDYYLDIANAVLKRSTCLRRKYGAVVVKNDEVVATGYNGSPRGCPNCCDEGICYREKLGVPKGERYELCRAVHAEQNALISCSRANALGATMYIVGEEMNGLIANPEPCLICAKLILNSGIQKVVGRTVDGEVIEIDVKHIVERQQ